MTSLIQANRLVIRPLEDWYKTVEERCSRIETFMQCPYRYKNEIQTKSTADHFVYGHLMHTMMQEFCKFDLTNDDDKIRQKELSKAMELLDLYPQYKDVIEPYFELMYAEWPYKAIATNVKVFLEVEAWPILFCITGEFDMVVETMREKLEWWFERRRKGIVDFKFPKWEWKENKIDWLFQKYLYTYLRCEERGRDDMDFFEYCIMTKHQKWWVTRPRMQKFREEINKSYVSSKIRSIIVAYLTATYKEEFIHKIADHCFTCSIRNSGSCDARNK